MGWLSGALKDKARDEHGQPLIRLYRAHAVGSRQVDELIGLVKGVLADGVIYQPEIEFLLNWMQANQSVCNSWPANALYPRIAAALADGHVDEEEEAEIMSLLLATAGGAELPNSGDTSHSSSLPLSDPLPSIEVPGKVFCFTGKFNSGTRDWCQDQVRAKGGLSASTITKKLNYLVIGEIGSRDWLHSTFGTKIQKAVEYRDAGVPLHIIGEQYWYERIGV